MRLLSAVICLALQAHLVLANTEKTIFKAPLSARLPDTKPGKDLLDLPNIRHGDAAFRAALPVAFPSASAPHGKVHWLLLRDLIPSKRYELRVCWAATQPTSFDLQTYTIAQAFDSPELMRELVEAAKPAATGNQYSGKTAGALLTSTAHESLLYLRITAAADFYSSNQTLMSSPPDVVVDLILDPFLLGVFPASLAPTAVYIIVLALASWPISLFVWRFLAGPEVKKHTD